MLISVVVSTFNHGRFIAKALDSVLRQQVDFEVEIIVGDDASQDDTRDILRAYERANPDRIRLFLPPANLGGEGGGLFLALMAEARGDFIAILDGDDEWTDPEKLRKQAAFLLRHPECLLSFHNALVVYEDDKRPAHLLRADSDDCLFDVGQMLKLTTVQNSTLMLRRELLDPQRGWLDGLTLFEISDWAIAVLAATFGPVAYLGDPLSLYRQHAGGWWSLSRRTEQLAVTITQYEWLRSHLPAAHAPMIRLQIAQHALEMSREFERRRDFRGAALALSRCLSERPPEFEHYLPNEGSFGRTVWRKLARRAALYRWVGVNHLTWRLRPLAGDLRWRWARWHEGRRTRSRPVRGQSVGWIRLRPEPVDSQEHGALRSMELHWGASGASEVVVTIGTPGGAIFSRTTANQQGPTELTGGATTGPWVHDGMVFYLQDVSGGQPLSAANTLASVRAERQHRRPESARPVGATSTRAPEAPGLLEVSANVGRLLGRHISTIRQIATETECLVYEASFGSRVAIVKAGLSPDTSTIALEAWALERAREAGVPVPRYSHSIPAGRPSPET